MWWSRIVAATLLIGAACGAGTGRASAIEQFRDSNPGASDAESACVVDGLLDRYESAEIVAELTTSPQGAGFEEDQFREMFRCGLEGDIEETLVEQLRLAGIEGEEAACIVAELAESLTDADIDGLVSGSISEEFRIRFGDAMSGCGVAIE